MMAKHYDVISFGTGSAMTIVSSVIETLPKAHVAIIEKDIVGGICLTRGCIPSKMLLYPAELIANVQKTSAFGIDAEVRSVDSKAILERARKTITEESQIIEKGIMNHPRIDFYKGVGEFIGEYKVKVNNEIIGWA